MDKNFLLSARKQKQAARFKLCKLFTNVFVNFPFFPRVDFGEVLVYCLGAHNESYSAIGLSVAISSRH